MTDATKGRKPAIDSAISDDTKIAVCSAGGRARTPASRATHASANAPPTRTTRVVDVRNARTARPHHTGMRRAAGIQLACPVVAAIHGITTSMNPSGFAQYVV